LFNEFELNLRHLSKIGSDRMDDDGRIDRIKELRGNKRIPRKSTHTVFVHHKAHTE